MTEVCAKSLQYVQNDWSKRKMAELCAKWLQYLQNLSRNISTSLSLLTSAVNVGKWLASRPGHFTPGEEPPAATEQKAAWDLRTIGTGQWRNIFAPLRNQPSFWNPMPDRRIQTITPPNFTQNHTTPTTYFTLILPFYIPLTLCTSNFLFSCSAEYLCVSDQLQEGRHTSTSFGVAPLRSTPSPLKPTTCVLCSMLAPI